MKAMKTLFRLANLAARQAFCGDYYHLPQPKGAFIGKNEIKGYYNDLRLKAHWPGERDAQGIPISQTSEGKSLYFPTTIIQYGLGHYDLWLETHAEKHHEEFLKVAEWLLIHQDEIGGWDVFSQLRSEATNKYSAMVQGQAISLLLRAFLDAKEEKYLEAAKKAISLMLTPISEGGTIICEGTSNELFLEEVPTKERSLVLNGWVFAIFGLWDCTLVINDPGAKQALTATLNTFEKHIDRYDRGYWSNYDWRGAIASPFYHRLNIALLQALYELTERSIFGEVAERWARYERSFYNRAKAVSRKIWEKMQSDQEIVNV